MTKIQEVLENHPLKTIGGIILTVVGVTWTVANYLFTQQYQSKLTDYETTLSSVERRLGGKEVIDVAKLIINKASQNRLPSNSIFHAKDNFYHTTDKYWEYKYTNPIELWYIRNGSLAPKRNVNNPIDSPLHVWFGKEQFRITNITSDPIDTPQTPVLFEQIQDSTFIYYYTDQVVFRPTITLVKQEKSKYSEKLRLKADLDSVQYSINLDQMSQNELLGRFLNNQISSFYKAPAVNLYSKEILSVQKSGNVIYAQCLEVVKDVEINHKHLDAFYVYREFLIINTENDIYTLNFEVPSKQPLKNGLSFQKVTEWFSRFGIVGD